MEMLSRMWREPSTEPPRTKRSEVLDTYYKEVMALEEGRFESLVNKVSEGNYVPTSRLPLDEYRSQVEERDSQELALVREQIGNRPMRGKPVVDFLM
ncbi:hypothetical protein KC644_01990 [Candidatus Berkelbacteria bacterium]|nr:hypothetical protein [Candidatus Berkelbacteria bacterium]